MTGAVKSLRGIIAVPFAALDAAFARPSLAERLLIAFLVVGGTVAALGLLQMVALLAYVNLTVREPFPFESVQYVSPDGRYRLVVYPRVKRPVFDLLDPPGIVRFEVQDTTNGKLLASAKSGLWEADQFEPPKVEWGEQTVTVSGFDSGTKDEAVRLRLSAAAR